MPSTLVVIPSTAKERRPRPLCGFVCVRARLCFDLIWSAAAAGWVRHRQVSDRLRGQCAIAVELGDFFGQRIRLKAYSRSGKSSPFLPSECAPHPRQCRATSVRFSGPSSVR
jgi:hypothetical protein